jgi:hypothetical protein
VIAARVLAEESVPAERSTDASSARRAEDFSDSGRGEERRPWKIVGRSELEVLVLMLSIFFTAACFLRGQF